MSSDILDEAGSGLSSWVAPACGAFRKRGEPVVLGGSPVARASAPQAAADGPSLSKGHISALTPNTGNADVRPFVEFHLGGTVMKVSTVLLSEEEKRCKEVYEKSCPERTSKRGKVDKFSRKSRKRLRDNVAATRESEPPLFACLTLPKEFPTDPEFVKAFLDNFALRLKRRYPGASFIWKLEFQERGAAHFHLFVWGIPDYKPIGLGAVPDEIIARYEASWLCFRNEWLPNAWYEVVGSGDEKHLRHGTSCERLESRARAIAYCSGYMAKDDQTLPGQYVGRYWGIVNRARIPWAPLVHQDLPKKVAVRTHRTMRRYVQSQQRVRFLRQLAENKKPRKWRVRSGVTLVAYISSEFLSRRLSDLLELFDS